MALKDKKPQKIAQLLVAFSLQSIWQATEIQELCGNLIWLAFFLPRIRAFTTPLLMFLVLANTTSDGRIRLDRYPELHAAALVSLNFLIFVVSLNPKCSVYRFLDLYPTRSIMCYSDAAG